MNKTQLFWIVPMCVVVGYLFGLYFNLPNNITIDIGPNMMNFSDKIGNLSFNYTGCPDCYCEHEEYNATINTTIMDSCENDVVLNRIDENLINLQKKGIVNSTTNNTYYIIDEYIVNCSMERSIDNIQSSILRIETSIKNNLSMKCEKCETYPYISTS